VNGVDHLCGTPADGDELNPHPVRDATSKQQYLNEGKAAYDKFDVIWKPILRNDHFASMASLDKVAMLDPASDQMEIRALLDRLCHHAKHDLDVIQFAAVH
jgi:hypothetical protein